MTRSYSSQSSCVPPAALNASRSKGRSCAASTPWYGSSGPMSSASPSTAAQSQLARATTVIVGRARMFASFRVPPRATNTTTSTARVGCRMTPAFTTDACTVPSARAVATTQRLWSAAAIRLKSARSVMHHEFYRTRVLKSHAMLAFGGVNSGIYKFLLVLHILSAIVGLGAVMLNGLYAAQTQRRPGPAGRAVFEANLFVTQVAEYVIYLIPIFGIALIYTSDKVWKFSQTWTWLSLLLYLIAIGISHAVMKPGAKRILALMIEMEQG